jgi:hypothetical protein
LHVPIAEQLFLVQFGYFLARKKEGLVLAAADTKPM